MGLRVMYHTSASLCGHLKIDDKVNRVKNSPTNDINRVTIFSVYFICGLIIGDFSTLIDDIFRYMQDMEKNFFLAVYNLVLRFGFIGFFIEPPLCAIFLSKYFF